MNNYTDCWRKSMRIWPRRCAKRGAVIAAGGCIGPIMNASLVVVRNGTDATAFVALNKIAGGDELRNRCVSWEGECMRVW
jgi:hypothetical protein